MVPTVAGVDLVSTPRRVRVCDMLADMAGDMMHDETRIVIRLPAGTTTTEADEYARVLVMSMELMETEIHRLNILG